jgi:predicted PurR-regulated permease PerM
MTEAATQLIHRAHNETTSSTPSAATVEPVSASVVHVRTHGWSLSILVVIALVMALSLAKNFLIPLVFSILFAYTLNPVVGLMERIKIPRVLASALLLMGIMSMVAMNTGSLIAEVDAIVAKVPEVTRKISERLVKSTYGEPSLMQKVQTAAAEIEKATTQASGGKAETRKSVVNEPPVLRLREWVLLGSLSVMGFVGQVVMVLSLVFFLLVSGDTFKRKLVKLTPTLANKKITVRILSEINTSIQRYMFMLLVTNILVGMLSWVVFKSIGLENAGAWALMSALLHLIPYFGSVVAAIVTGLAAFMQMNSPTMGLVIAGSSIIVATFVGTFITTWMTGRIAKMNAAAVFIGLLFWGWLWGTWGLLLGIPIIVVIKVISEHVDDLGFVAELLGE